jgi:hypothetical protein
MMNCHSRKINMSDVPDLSNVVTLPVKRYVRFYKDFVECDFCGQQTRGRVYEGSQQVTCGACNAVLIEVNHDQLDVMFEPDF